MAATFWAFCVEYKLWACDWLNLFRDWRPWTLYWSLFSVARKGRDGGRGGTPSVRWSRDRVPCPHNSFTMQENQMHAKHFFFFLITLSQLNCNTIRRHTGLVRLLTQTFPKVALRFGVGFFNHGYSFCLLLQMTLEERAPQNKTEKGRKWTF